MYHNIITFILSTIKWACYTPKRYCFFARFRLLLLSSVVVAWLYIGLFK